MALCNNNIRNISFETDFFTFSQVILVCRCRWRSLWCRAHRWRSYDPVSSTLCCWGNKSPSAGTGELDSWFTSPPSTGYKFGSAWVLTWILIIFCVFNQKTVSNACCGLQDRVCGLCGNFDGNVNNDLMSSNNQLEVDSSHFGNSWKVSPSCADVTQVTSGLKLKDHTYYSVLMYYMCCMELWCINHNENLKIWQLLLCVCRYLHLAATTLPSW